MTSNIRNVDLNLLVVLDALFDERSVTRAADRLALTQPTVSGMLKRLRIIFEDDLYIRTSHGIIPTPRAEALAGPVKEILTATHSLLVQEEFEPTKAEFDVKLCGSDYLHNTILSPFAGEILRQAPNAKISLLAAPAGNNDALLERGEIDLLFGIREYAPSVLPVLSLYKEKLVCISSYAKHKEGQSISLVDLCNYNHVVLKPTGAPITKTINDLLRSRGLARNIVIDVPNFAAVFQSMRHAELIAFLPERMTHFNSGQFKILQTDLETPATEVVVNWHPRMNNDAKSIWLRDILRLTVRNYLDR